MASDQGKETREEVRLALVWTVLTVETGSCTGESTTVSWPETRVRGLLGGANTSTRARRDDGECIPAEYR